MKKMVLFLFFAVTLVATFMYYDDPRYYRRQFQRQMRKCRRQMDCWQDCSQRAECLLPRTAGASFGYYDE